MKAFRGIPRLIRNGVVPGFAIFAILITASIALAHAVSIWAYVEKGHVYVEAFFSNGSKVQDGSIFVLNAKGEKLLEGKTDKEGKFDFMPQAKEDLTILLDLGSGHRTEFAIKAKEFDGENAPVEDDSKKSDEPCSGKTE